MNGASYVTIDGSNSGARPGSVQAIEATRDLTITNTSTATATAAIQIDGLGWAQEPLTLPLRTLISRARGPKDEHQRYLRYFPGWRALGTGGSDNDNNSFINNAITKVNVGIFSSGENAANPVQGTVMANNPIGPGLSTRPDRWCRNCIFTYQWRNGDRQRNPARRRAVMRRFQRRHLRQVWDLPRL